MIHDEGHHGPFFNFITLLINILFLILMLIVWVSYLVKVLLANTECEARQLLNIDDVIL